MAKKKRSAANKKRIATAEVELSLKAELPQGQPYYIGSLDNDRAPDPSSTSDPILARMQARSRIFRAQARDRRARDFGYLAVSAMEVLNRPSKTVGAFLELLRQERHPGARKIESLESEAAALCFALEIRALNEGNKGRAEALAKIGGQFAAMYAADPSLLNAPGPDLYAVLTDFAVSFDENRDPDAGGDRGPAPDNQEEREGDPEQVQCTDFEAEGKSQRRKAQEPTDQQAAAAEAMVSKGGEVGIQYAAWYLRCTKSHVRRLVRKGKLSGSRTRPMQVTTASLRAYKWAGKGAPPIPSSR